MRLLGGKSPKDRTAYKSEHFKAVGELLGHAYFALSLSFNTTSQARRFVRKKDKEHLGGASIADCILAGEPESLSRAERFIDRYMEPG